METLLFLAFLLFQSLCLLEKVGLQSVIFCLSFLSSYSPAVSTQNLVGRVLHFSKMCFLWHFNNPPFCLSMLEVFLFPSALAALLTCTPSAQLSSSRTAKFAEYNRGRSHIYKHVFHPAVSRIEIASIYLCLFSLCSCAHPAVLIHLYKYVSCLWSVVVIGLVWYRVSYVSLAVLKLRDLPLPGLKVYTVMQSSLSLRGKSLSFRTAREYRELR